MHNVRRRSRGFSLLELLVVLFVVIMITSLASLNVGSGNQELQLEAQLRDLRNVALFALDEAQLSGRDIGLLLLIERRDGETVYGYDWRERRPEGWRRPLAASDVFAQRRLPAEVRLSLALENMPGIEPEPAPVAEDVAPQVIFYASGEVVPGELEVRRRENDELLWLLQWDLLGRMELLPKGLPAGEGRDGRL
ncbi:general secretion pathway protein GspH [Kineobactrum sediminis]|uniref:General secretion pathway protein GspH n=1 Tax=Kineobactrum sediminis TaxID=1905677 RepID=A0A2N5Y0K4_9GAMM|nr:GspH/FimT family pseudopilin [Kineobactrum sediminis]PLW81930.1 general secretion pathway protein GspH [Kineobactrum sediminis]